MIGYHETHAVIEIGDTLRVEGYCGAPGAWATVQCPDLSNPEMGFVYEINFLDEPIVLSDDDESLWSGDGPTEGTFQAMEVGAVLCCLDEGRAVVVRRIN